MDKYVVIFLRSKYGSFLVRKLGNKNEVGICVTQKDPYQFPSSRSTEFFLTKEKAKEVISALQKYFNL